MGKKPEKLYHGTSLANLSSVCKHGLKRGTPERCGVFSKDEDFLEDCIGNISLAVREKDAVFFACANQLSAHEIGRVPPSQVILEINAKKLDRNKMIFRDMFGRKEAEVKYLGDIPSDTITRVRIRKFYMVNNKLKTEETTLKGCKKV